MLSDDFAREMQSDGLAPSREASDRVTQITLEESVGFRLSRLVRVRRERWAGELRALGLTPGQAAILRATRDHPRQALRALARTLEFDAMAVKRCVDGLETRGWVVTSARDDDRRVRVAALTKEGEVLMRRLDESVHHQESTLRAHLSLSQYEMLSALLQHLERAEGVGADDEATNNEDSEEHS
jgi:DNA-binding MarR family transcriptional regulator